MNSEESDLAGRGWEVAPGAIALEPGALHVWRHDLDRGPRDRSLLDERERSRSDAFAFVRDRSRFIAGRCFLRRAMGRYLRQDPAHVAITVDASGKPVLSEASAPSFNLSHAEGIAYLAVTFMGPVGLDVELDHDVKDVAVLALTVFSPSEIAEVGRYSGRVASAAFLRGWTRKEAFVKAVGVGIVADLKAITVGTVAVDVTVPRIAGVSTSAWVVRTLHCASGEHVAVALPRSPDRVRFYALDAEPQPRLGPSSV